MDKCSKQRLLEGTDNQSELNQNNSAKIADFPLQPIYYSDR